jgi:hypothetical protein
MNALQTVAAVKAILPVIAHMKPEVVVSDINDVLAKASNPTLPCLDRLVDAAQAQGLQGIVDPRRKNNYWTA